MNTHANAPSKPPAGGIRRRGVLRAAGAMMVVAAGGLAWRGWDQNVGMVRSVAPYEPWRDWKDRRTTGPLALVSAAILASNPHNTQPWRFRVGEQRIDVFADPNRNLGLFDPYRREMHIGLGCAIENIVVAAGRENLAPSVELMPTAVDLTHVASIRLDPRAAGDAPSPLLPSLARRHTNRGAYARDLSVSAETQAILAANARNPIAHLALFEAGTPEGQAFATLTQAATERLVADSQVIAASDAWFRGSWQETEAARDGVTVASAGMPPLMEALARMAPPLPPSVGHDAFVSGTKAQLATAPLFGVITVEDPRDRAALLTVGRLWQRLHLQATALGLSMQPLNQLVEWREANESRGRPTGPDEAQSLLLDGAAGWRVVFPFRAGYAVRPAKPSARRDLHEVIV